MSKVKINPSTLLAPLPVALVSCGSIEKPNCLTVAWTGIVNSKPPMTYISVRQERFSHSIINESREFVINIPSSDLVRKVDSCGVISGKNTDKFKKFELTACRSEIVASPQIQECPLSIECKVTEVIPLPSHDLFLAQIVSISADSELIDEKGALHTERGHLISYIHGGYYTIGKRIGTFGFSVKKKKKTARK